jgi:hypothetical protein
VKWLLIALLLPGCAWRLKVPKATYGEVYPLPLVHPGIDPKRWYTPVETEVGTQLFFVDTGYSRTTCDDDLIASLGLNTRGKRRIGGEAGTVLVTKARLPPIELGGHTIEGLVCLVRDLDTTSSITDPHEVPIAGVLGIDALRPFRVELDAAQAEIRLRDPHTVQRLPRKSADSVPLRREQLWGMRVRVPLDIGEAETWPILDTGASNTYIDGDRLGLKPSWTERDVLVRGTGPGGAITLDRDYFEVPLLHIGAHDFGPITITNRPQPKWEPGLLGLDILDSFAVELDFRGRSARLTSIAAQSRPSWRVWSATEAPAAVRITAPAPDQSSD